MITLLIEADRYKYFEPCRSWECPSCYAMNDEEDEWCEICKIDRNVEQAEQMTLVQQPIQLRVDSL